MNFANRVTRYCMTDCASTSPFPTATTSPAIPPVTLNPTPQAMTAPAEQPTPSLTPAPIPIPSSAAPRPVSPAPGESAYRSRFTVYSWSMRIEGFRGRGRSYQRRFWRRAETPHHKCQHYLTGCWHNSVFHDLIARNRE